MTRLAVPLAAATATLLLAVPALAADYSDMFDSGANLRSGFSNDYDNSDQGDPLSFEVGVRYWYSWGAQSFAINSLDPALGVSDTSHSAEAFFRINDASSNYYAKGLAGASFLTGGSFSGLSAGTVNGGSIGYAGGDIGYSLIGGGKDGPTFGPFAGYMYWNDSPNASVTSLANSYTTATSAADITFDPVTGQTFWPGDSTPNLVQMNMLRVGFSGTAKLGSFVDVSGEVAAVPYAKMSGQLGTSNGATYYYSDPPGSGGTAVQTVPGYNVANIQASPTTLDGWGYGAMAEAMVGLHPTQNLTFRLGGRLWYLQGKADATFSRASIGNPSDSDAANPLNFDTAPSFFNQQYITRDNPWSVFRYGVLAEMSYSF